MKNLYDSPSFIAFLRQELDGKRFGRGAKSKLAEHLGVRPSLVSLALSETQGFSLEQGLKVAGFLGLDADEREFLLLLLQRDRAGSHALKLHFQGLIDRRIADRNKIRGRVRSAQGKLSEEDLHEYYGAWFHTAVHMCVRNGKRRSIPAIAEDLRIEPARVKESLKLLGRLGFVRETAGEFLPTDQRFHVSSESKALRAHHSNWRQSALRSLDEARPEDLHYSLVFSADDEAFAKIRQILLRSVETADTVIRDAKDKRVYAFNWDLFAVTRKS